MSMESVARCTLPKRERLHLKRDLDLLFDNGQSFVAYPLRVVYLISTTPREERAQMMVSVGKKYFRRAVKRNRIKRLVRECYRLNKHAWLSQLQEHNVWALVAYMSVSKEMPNHADVERAVLKSFRRIISELELRASTSSNIPNDEAN